MYIMGTLLRHGSAEQKRRYLPEIAAGKLRLQAFGVTEPTTGTDTTQLKTRAEREGDHYVVNGQKVWIVAGAAIGPDAPSGAHHAARSRDEEERRAFGVSGRYQGVARPRARHQAAAGDDQSQHRRGVLRRFASSGGEPDRRGGQGFRYILDSMNAERILIASEAVGDGRWFVAKSRNMPRERIVFGRPIGRNQGVQFPIARAYAEIEAAALMVRKAAAPVRCRAAVRARGQHGQVLGVGSRMACGRSRVQSHGGFGFAREYDIERKWRETRLFQVAPISTNLVLAYIGEHVLGMPRSY